jgi:uncharacterized protein YfiM (DUF2279 family)
VKLNLTILALTFTIPFSLKSYAEVEYDKKLHAGVSAVIGSVSQVVTKDTLKSSTICMSLGVAKELYDEVKYEGFDEKDLLADTIGCAVGILGVKSVQLYKEDGSLGLRLNVKF